MPQTLLLQSISPVKRSVLSAEGRVSGAHGSLACRQCCAATCTSKLCVFMCHGASTGAYGAFIHGSGACCGNVTYVRSLWHGERRDEACLTSGLCWHLRHCSQSRYQARSKAPHHETYSFLHMARMQGAQRARAMSQAGNFTPVLERHATSAAASALSSQELRCEADQRSESAQFVKYLLISALLVRSQTCRWRNTHCASVDVPTFIINVCTKS